MQSQVVVMIVFPLKTIMHEVIFELIGLEEFLDANISENKATTCLIQLLHSLECFVK